MIGLSLIAGLTLAQQKVIFDCDIADDIDDAYAMALLTKVPNIKILGVTTAFGDTVGRATVAAKLLNALGRPDISIHIGRGKDHPQQAQFKWATNYQSKAIKDEPAIEFMRREIN